MVTSFHEIQNQLKARKFAPVYLLHGDESYYIDKIALWIEANALSESEKGFNQTILYGRDVDVATILNNARRFPMMSERQVVIVKEAQDVSDLTKVNGEKLLTAYLSNPSPSTILVFSHKHKKIDGRSKIGKVFEKNAVVMESKKLYDDKVPDWITEYVGEKNTKIDNEARRLLAEYVGNNLERLTHEIDKILINFTEPTIINANHVQKYVGISKDYNVFELQKAISFRNMGQAIKIANYFEANPKNNPLIPVIAVIFSLFTKILMIHKEPNQPDANLAKMIGLGSTYFLKEYLVAVRNYDLQRSLMNIGYIRAADLKSKGIGSGGMSDGQILKELLINIMS